MKPFKKTIVTKTVYWDCGRGHNHISEQIARKCIEKYQNIPEENIYAKGLRNLAIVKQFLDGRTPQDLSEALNIPINNICNLIRRYIRKSWSVKEKNRTGPYVLHKSPLLTTYWEKGLAEKLHNTQLFSTLSSSELLETVKTGKDASDEDPKKWAKRLWHEIEHFLD